jgi:hypothetical protein
MNSEFKTGVCWGKNILFNSVTPQNKTRKDITKYVPRHLQNVQKMRAKLAAATSNWHIPSLMC